MPWQRETWRVCAAVVVVLAAALAAAAPPASGRAAPRLIDRHGKEVRGRPARWLQQSHMPLVGGRIRLIIGRCPLRPKFAGCVYSRRPRRLWLNMSAYNPKSVLYHELGHTFDFVLLRRSDRKKFKRVMHLRRPGWFAGEGPPSELFAEAYAYCSRFGMKPPTGKQRDWTRSLYRYRPSHKQYKATCTIIKRAGAPKRQRSRPKPQPPANPPRVIEEEKAPPQQPPPKEPGDGVLPPGLPKPLPLPSQTLGF
jgi:hypothetical protein